MIDPLLRSSLAWATRELATAAPHSIRAERLTAERDRLAGIAWRLKDDSGGRQRQLIQLPGSA